MIYHPGRKALPAPECVMGPTRAWDWLMVDLRTALKLQPGDRMYEICQDLSHLGACGVVEATLVIDLTAVRPEDRAYVVDLENWPKPPIGGGPDYPEVS